jgi:hypothetical protein
MRVKPKAFDQEEELHDVVGIGGDYKLRLPKIPL